MWSWEPALDKKKSNHPFLTEPEEVKISLGWDTSFKLYYLNF